MNASGFITFFTYMLRHIGLRFYKGLYVTFIVAPDLGDRDFLNFFQKCKMIVHEIKTKKKDFRCQNI